MTDNFDINKNKVSGEEELSVLFDGEDISSLFNCITYLQQKEKSLVRGGGACCGNGCSHGNHAFVELLYYSHVHEDSA